MDKLTPVHQYDWHKSTLPGEGKLSLGRGPAGALFYDLETLKGMLQDGEN